MSIKKYLIPSKEELLWKGLVSRIVIIFYKIEFFIGWILLGALTIIYAPIISRFSVIFYLIYFFFGILPLIWLIMLFILHESYVNSKELSRSEYYITKNEVIYSYISKIYDTYVFLDFKDIERIVFTKLRFFKKKNSYIDFYFSKNIKIKQKNYFSTKKIKTELQNQDKLPNSNIPNNENNYRYEIIKPQRYTRGWQNGKYRFFMIQDSNELLKTLENSIWADKIEVINKNWKWIWRQIIVIILVIVLIIITIISRTIPVYNPYLLMVILIISSISLFIFCFFINPKLKEIEEKERESKAELKRDKTIKK